MGSRAEETREKLIRAGISMFAKYGYAGASVKMIVEAAGLTPGTISLHFESKENFYRSVLEYVAKEAVAIYGKFYANIEASLHRQDLLPDQVLALIGDLVRAQLYVSVGNSQPEYIALLYWEQVQPAADFHPITDLVNAKCEEALALLLMKYDPAVSEQTAIIISRLINGGIIAFGEHPGFIDMIKRKLAGQPFEDVIQQTLFPFIMSAIQQYPWAGTERESGV